MPEPAHQPKSVRSGTGTRTAPPNRAYPPQSWCAGKGYGVSPDTPKGARHTSYKHHCKGAPVESPPAPPASPARPLLRCRVAPRFGEAFTGHAVSDSGPSLARSGTSTRCKPQDPDLATSDFPRTKNSIRVLITISGTGDYPVEHLKTLEDGRPCP